MFFFFFFQAEDGIRDHCVTGVQTCALPIWLRSGQLLPWTRAPYGYRLHPERPRDPAALQIDPVAAVVVSELFAAYAAGGVTLHTLAAQLTARGVPTPTGKPIWRPTTISN